MCKRFKDVGSYRADTDNTSEGAGRRGRVGQACKVGAVVKGKRHQTQGVHGLLRAGCS